MTTLMMLRQIMMSGQHLQVAFKTLLANVLGINPTLSTGQTATTEATAAIQLDSSDSVFRADPVASIEIDGQAELTTAGEVDTLAVANSAAIIENVVATSVDLTSKSMVNATAGSAVTVSESSLLDAWQTLSVGIARVSNVLQTSLTMFADRFSTPEASSSAEVVPGGVLATVVPNYSQQVANSAELSHTAVVEFQETARAASDISIAASESGDLEFTQGVGYGASISSSVAISSTMETMEAPWLSPVRTGNSLYIQQAYGASASESTLNIS